MIDQVRPRDLPAWMDTLRPLGAQQFSALHDARFEPPQDIFGHPPLDGRQVLLAHPVSRMCEPEAEIPIVCQQKESFSVAVQPPDRIEE